MAKKYRKCELEECSLPHLAKGLCLTHYNSMRKHGDPRIKVGRAGAANGRWAGGKSAHPLYLIYHDMVARCGKPNHLRYDDYGGRGISVHREWVEDFWAFVRDVGERPEGKTKGGRAYWQLDRIDNDGNYEPGNVRWATPSQQGFNQRPRNRQTVCRRGHEMTEANTYTNPRTGERKCRGCSRINDRNRKRGQEYG